jgi:hypothetical protein
MFLVQTFPAISEIHALLCGSTATSRGQTASLSTTIKNAAPDSGKGGAGLGNVENRMLPSADDSKIFKHCKYPRTTTIIG